MASSRMSFGSAFPLALLFVSCVTGIPEDLFASGKSMAYFLRSFGNVISMALLFVSCVTGITRHFQTACNYAEQVALPSDVAHRCRFDSVIRSNNPQWYDEGMQLFAYKHNGYRWVKRKITWAITDFSGRMSRESVVRELTAAFNKWAAVTPFTFKQVSPEQQPDVRIKLIPMGPDLMGRTIHNPNELVSDNSGKTIIFNSQINWTNVNGTEWTNPRYIALHEIGHVLGLAVSPNPYAIMSDWQVNYERRGDPELKKDDIDGVQALYGGPVSRTNSRESPATSSFHGGPVSRTYGRGNTGSSSLPGGPASRTQGRAIPAPSTSSSSSSSSTSTSSSSSDDDTSSTESGERWKGYKENNYGYSPYIPRR